MLVGGREAMTEAERLARALTDWSTKEVRDLDRLDAADLLRSQAAEIEALRAANERFGKRQEWWNERMFSLAQERNELLADAERFRWLAERTTSTGLARWVHPFQFLCDAVDARMKDDAAIDAARQS